MSLTGAYDDANIFAKMLRGEIPCVKVFEDEAALCFLDIFPQSPGHTLVIPKGVRARNFLEMPTEKIGPYLERVQRVAQAVTKALKPDGVRVITFNGAPAGQSVYHLHFHIVPVWEGRSVATHGHGQQADQALLRETAARIAAAF